MFKIKNELSDTLLTSVREYFSERVHGYLNNLYHIIW